jgi:hypothetical protein
MGKIGRMSMIFKMSKDNFLFFYLSGWEKDRQDEQNNLR